MKSTSDLGFDPSKLSKEQHDKIFVNYTQLEELTGLTYVSLRVMQSKREITEPYRFVSPHYSLHVNSFFKIDEVNWELIEKRKQDIVRRSVNAIKRQGYEVSIRKANRNPIIGG